MGLLDEKLFLFRQRPVEKGHLQVHVVTFTVIQVSKSKEDAVSRSLHNCSKGIQAVNAVLLLKSSNN
jgi:hypothetical protein